MGRSCQNVDWQNHWEVYLYEGVSWVQPHFNPRPILPPHLYKPHKGTPPIVEDYINGRMWVFCLLNFEIYSQYYIHLYLHRLFVYCSGPTWLALCVRGSSNCAVLCTRQQGPSLNLYRLSKVFSKCLWYTTTEHSFTHTSHHRLRYLFGCLPSRHLASFSGATLGVILCVGSLPHIYFFMSFERYHKVGGTCNFQ